MSEKEITIKEQKQMLIDYFHRKMFLNDTSPCLVENLFEYTVVDDDIVLTKILSENLSDNVLEVPKAFDCADDINFSFNRELNVLNLNSISSFKRPCVIGKKIGEVYAEGLDVIPNNFASFSELYCLYANNAKKVCRGAFYACESLKDIFLDRVEEIETIAFSRCDSLECLTLLRVKKLAEKSFFKNLKLKEIHFKDINELYLYSFVDNNSDLTLYFHGMSNLDNVNILGGTKDEFLQKYNVVFKVK